MNDDLGKNVLACIERLELATRDLKQAFAAYLDGSPHVTEEPASVRTDPVVSAVVGASTEAGDVVEQLPPQKTVPMPVAAAEPKVETAPARPILRPATADVTFSETEEGDRIITPPSSAHGIKDLLKLVFASALLEDTNECWNSLQHLTHSDAIYGPRSIDHLRAFNWKKIRDHVDYYVEGADPASFRIQRTEPADFSARDKVKVFIKHRKGGSPAPIYLQRDEKFGKAWRVFQYGL